MNNTTSYYVHLSGELHMLCLEIWNKMYVVATCLLCTGCFTKFGILVLYSLVFFDTIFRIHPIQIDHVANAYKPFIQNSLAQHVVLLNNVIIMSNHIISKLQYLTWLMILWLTDRNLEHCLLYSVWVELVSSLKKVLYAWNVRSSPNHMHWSTFNIIHC